MMRQYLQTTTKQLLSSDSHCEDKCQQTKSDWQNVFKRASKHSFATQVSFMCRRVEGNVGLLRFMDSLLEALIVNVKNFFFWWMRDDLESFLLAWFPNLFLFNVWSPSRCDKGCEAPLLLFLDFLICQIMTVKPNAIGRASSQQRG